VRPNLFAVGDVKQSIYRFRLADPQRFLARDAKYRKKLGGQVIDLQQNFRSRAPLLAAINSVFVKLMTRQAAMIEYDRSHQLHAGATFPECDRDAFAGSPIELHLLHTQDRDAELDETAMDRTEWEATLVARRINEIVGSGVCVADGGAMRPIQYRDMVVLLRSAIHKADQMAGMLARHGIPVHSDARDGFFAATEIRDLLAVLQLMDNSQQDIPLAAYLRSPLAALPNPENSLAQVRFAYPADSTRHDLSPSLGAPACDELSRVGEGRGGGPQEDATPQPSPSPEVPFHSAVFRYATEHTDKLATHLRDALAQIAQWRTAANQKPLADVIWTIFEETDYLAFCGTLERGRQRVANLLALHERARDFGSFASQGLYRFLRFLRGVEEETDIGQPSMLGEGENAVRIMTVHQSKGLEFPVVFLPDLGKGFNLADMNGRILLDRGGILGMPAVDVPKQVRYPSMATVLARQQMRQQIVAEELRVLYVAMTRAREHLVLVGSCRESEVEKWTATVAETGTALAAETVIEAKSPLQWLVQTQTLLEREKTESLKVDRHTAEEMSQWTAAKMADAELTPWQKDRADLKPILPTPQKNAVAEEIIARLTHVYDDRRFVEKRAAVSVTEWGKKDAPSGSGFAPHPLPELPQEGQYERERLAPPRSVAGKLPLQATDKGTATHLVLQHLVMHAGPAIPQQVAEMVERCLMTTEQAKSVDYASIEWFLNCDLGKHLAATSEKDLMREVPFALAMNEPDAAGLDRTMLRGRIDLLAHTTDGWIVVDYKTDSVNRENVNLAAERYREQVSLYRQALEQLAGIKIVAVYLVFLSPHVILKMEPRMNEDERG
jgi:ATP-dependent helicase/nuclease subunit A